MPFQFSIQSQDGKTDFLMETGSTTIFVGANGSGKTRLAVHLETGSRPVSRAIAEHEGFSGDQLNNVLKRLKTAIFDKVSSDEEKNLVVYRHCRRQLDLALKSVDVSAEKDLTGIAAALGKQVADIKLEEIFATLKGQLDAAIASKDLVKFLSLYDNKGLFSLAASHIKPSKATEFKNWIPRILGSGNSPKIREAFLEVLPQLIPK
jgi:hypothetical protein